EPMRQRDAGNRDAERARVGEVRQAETTRLVLLPEDDVLFRAGHRPPTPHAPFQRAPDAGADLGMAPPYLFENRNGADARGRLDPMRQRDAGNRDAERARVGEVRQAETTRLVLLPEDDVLFRAGHRPPTPHAPFQRAPDAGADLGMAPPYLFENRNGADARGR